MSKGSNTFFSVRNRFLFALDILIVIFSYLFCALIVKNVHQFVPFVMENWYLLGVNCLTFVTIHKIFGIYSTIWVFGGARDYFRLVLSCLISSILSLMCFFVMSGYVTIYFKLIIMVLFMIGVLSIGSRMSIRGLNRLNSSYHSSTENRKRLLIVGAGIAANLLIKEIENNEKLDYEIVGLVDDDLKKKNSILNSVKIIGNTYDIPKVCSALRVEEIILAIPSASSKRKKSILEICSETDCVVKILPTLGDLSESNVSINNVKNVQIEDLLGRDEIILDNKGISEYIHNNVVFVTGGGGSIGSELCRQIMKFNPKKLVIIDIYENNAYDLQMELNEKYPENKPDVIIASVRDIDRLESIFDTYRPSIVFHAAAHKHVPLMEDSPEEAIKNNVFGTYNVAKCADKFKVKRFIMISTDKAVNPTNVMGATKRMCEMIVQSMQKISATEFVAVRFGNVLGSNGSVIPLFKRQIENGGPLTLTDENITRFFMTIPEAARLVLQAASYAKGGEIFVLDMGEPVRIYDLAKNLIKLSGLRLGVDIQIKITGLRPGEKLFEELLMNEEGLENTAHKKIFVGKPSFTEIDEIRDNMKLLSDAISKHDNDMIKHVLTCVVPTYTITNNDKKQAVG